MFLSKYVLYLLASAGETHKNSVIVANAMMVELLNYGIMTDKAILDRIAHYEPGKARETAYEILKSFTIGDVNPPLFDEWEDREYFSFGELVVQIAVYMIQVSGNDLANPDYLDELKDRVEFKKVKVLKLSTEGEAGDHFQSLLSTGQSRKQQKTIEAFAKEFPVGTYIKSDESRIAVLLARGLDNLIDMKAKPADILRYFAARKEFEQVNLPHGVIYDAMTWQERKAAFEFLSTFDNEYILEGMGNNRAAWNRFFRHTHLFQQQEFLRKYDEFSACAWVSVGSKAEATPIDIRHLVNKFVSDGVAEITVEGALAYRTFASRVATAVEKQDYEAIEALMCVRPTYLLRNIATISNAVTTENRMAFLALCRKSIAVANPEVLFSILQIDSRANYRIIDVKGDTIVQEADYSPYITAIQQDIEIEINRRYGRQGKVGFDESLKDTIVPFLARNQELYRGTCISFWGEKYLHFFMHWIQEGRRTDLDHSHIIFHDNHVEQIAFYNQANDYIAQSGDITNAPAPNGATEYSVFSLNKIPASVRYIVPVINVYDGDNFKDLQEAYAGFMFNDSQKFNINREHVRYDLSQPARMNVPFVIDVDNKEIIIVDYNARSEYRGTSIAMDFQETLLKIIDASQSMNKMTIERFANLLSGEGETELTISAEPKGKAWIAPSELSKLIA
jgi:stress response protein SCP2